MARVEKCPICKGSGRVDSNDGVYYHAAPRDGDIRYPDCHGCDGKGWVEVAEDEQPFRIPYYPPMLFSERLYGTRTTTRKCGL